MKETLLLNSNRHHFHITARTLGKNFFRAPLDDVWYIMCELLVLATKKRGLAIHAFVLMKNHFHLLCHAPQSNIDDIMILFLRYTALRLKDENSENKPLWEGTYHVSRIENFLHYNYVYKYIYQNPIRAGIESRVQDYRFSTIIRHVPFPLHSSSPLGFGGIEGELLWLNDVYDRDLEEIIRSGLKKSKFRPDANAGMKSGLPPGLFS